MTIKEFTFPKVKEWINSRNFSYSTKIGRYYVEIGIFSWGQYNYEIEIALSINSNPLNIYSPKLFTQKLTVDTLATSDDDIIEWYNQSTHNLNEFWKKYILETYTTE